MRGQISDPEAIGRLALAFPGIAILVLEVWYLGLTEWFALHRG